MFEQTIGSYSVGEVSRYRQKGIEEFSAANGKDSKLDTISSPVWKVILRRFGTLAENWMSEGNYIDGL